MEPVYVGIIGAGENLTEDMATVACHVGRFVAERGAIVVCGGLGGVMEEAAKGAGEAGGTVVGILPGPTRTGANSYLDISIPTGLGESRNALVARASDVLIAVGGEFGTLSEIALALKIGKPVVGVGTWQLAKDGEFVEAVVPAVDAADAVEKAFGLLGR